MPQFWYLIDKIRKVPLKPSQKVRVLNLFALLRLIFQADHCDVPVATLAALDAMVQKAVKEWLHLSPLMCDGLLYSRCRDGGLGLKYLVPAIQIR
ncbi:hypothetical protein LDENG_00111870 [Lucifuga dentata]|nr:hypothetical protein LDENG_00111870 [Lucifuga dentata]